MAGLLITMEGVEGSGKSTQLRRLAERMERLQLPLVCTKEPGGTALGAELRFLLLAPHTSGETWCHDAELLLFYADRAQHLAKVVRPSLREGRIVLVDRFEDSTRAYQGASGLEEAAMDQLAHLVLRGLKPDLTLILDMDPEVSLARAQARNAALGDGFKETRFDSAALAFHRRVRERFLAIAHQETGRVTLVDADQEADDVHQAIWASVLPRLREAGFRVN